MYTYSQTGSIAFLIDAVTLFPFATPRSRRRSPILDREARLDLYVCIRLVWSSSDRCMVKKMNGAKKSPLKIAGEAPTLNLQTASA